MVSTIDFILFSSTLPASCKSWKSLMPLVRPERLGSFNSCLGRLSVIALSDLPITFDTFCALTAERPRSNKPVANFDKSGTWIPAISLNLLGILRIL